MTEELPWRGPGEGRPQIPLPPGRMPLRHAGSWRKAWRYVAAFCDEAMVCAARVKVGPFGQTFWAVLDRSTGELHESTRTRLPGARGEVWTELSGLAIPEPGRASRPLGSARGEPSQVAEGADEPELTTRIEAPNIRAFLRLGTGRWAESVCPTPDGGYVWTRKRAPVPIELDLRIGERRIRSEAFGVEDESAGYHPRPTEWSWSAGIGRAADGRPVGWNLVQGINDPESGSERAIWHDGAEREPGRVRFDPDLAWIEFPSGERLAFSAEAERVSEKNMGIVRYTYRQPFGTFSGSLDGIELAEGTGVMEHHLAYW